MPGCQEMNKCETFGDNSNENWNYIGFVATLLVLISFSSSMTLDSLTAGRVSVPVAV